MDYKCAKKYIAYIRQEYSRLTADKTVINMLDQLNDFIIEKENQECNYINNILNNKAS